MTVDPSALVTTTASPADPARERAAEAARSMLACPREVSLVVDGLDDVSEGIDGDQLGMRDVDGLPTFTCPPGAALAQAGAEGRRALVTLVSGLGRAGASEREGDLRIEGRLHSQGVETCPCCPEPRVQISLRPDVVLVRVDRAARGQRAVRVAVDDFVSRRHRLNRGFLQRSVEHANACHQEELRHAVAATTGTRLGDVVGVQLADLTPQRVDLRWVDRAGAHARRLTFDSPATSPEQLGDLLRRELHSGLC